MATTRIGKRLKTIGFYAGAIALCGWAVLASYFFFVRPAAG